MVRARNDLVRELEARGYEVRLHTGKWEVRAGGILIASTPATKGTSAGLATVTQAVRRYERQHHKR